MMPEDVAGGAGADADAEVAGVDVDVDRNTHKALAEVGVAWHEDANEAAAVRTCPQGNRNVDEYVSVVHNAGGAWT